MLYTRQNRLLPDN